MFGKNEQGEKEGRWEGFPLSTVRKKLISKCETTDINNINLRGQRITF